MLQPCDGSHKWILQWSHCKGCKWNQKKLLCTHSPCLVNGGAESSGIWLHAVNHIFMLTLPWRVVSCVGNSSRFICRNDSIGKEGLSAIVEYSQDEVIKKGPSRTLFLSFTQLSDFNPVRHQTTKILLVYYFKINYTAHTSQNWSFEELGQFSFDLETLQCYCFPHVDWLWKHLLIDCQPQDLNVCKHTS